MTGCYVGCVPPTLAQSTSVPSSIPMHAAHVGGQLPFTGGDVLELLLLGVAIITIGIAFLRFHR